MVSTNQPALRARGRATRSRVPAAHWLSTAGFGNTERIVLAALALLFLATGLVRPESLSLGNARNILIAAIPLIIMAVGQVLVVATAGIDLSVGSVFSLTGMATAAASSHGVGTVVSVVLGLATGLVFGVFNGFCVAVLSLTPFVVTLVTLSVGASLAFIVTGGNSVPVDSPGLNNVYDGLTLGIPNHLVIPLVLVVAVQAFLSLAVAGRWLYAVGSNHHAARLVGIPTRTVLLSAYAASGLCAALAAVLQLSYLSNAEVSAGTGMELQAIAAVVIGGASLFGGRGSALGALFGALIITAIQNTVNLLGINTFWQGTVTGAVILAAVLADRIGTTVRSLREGRTARSEPARKEAAA